MRRPVSPCREQVDAALRGFKPGLVGSGAINPNTDRAYHDDQTGTWFGPAVPASDAFAFAQPDNNDRCDRFSAFLAPVSDAYGSAYSDLIQSTFAGIRHATTERMVVTILDQAGIEGGVVPVPLRA